jgi:hypothetical protein
MDQLKDIFLGKIKILSETIWDRRANKTEIELWLENFQSDDKCKQEKERLHALYLLSQFMYFANNEMRVLLRSMYRDLIRYPIIECIRKSNQDTCDITYINEEFAKELHKTRFLGVGNPSESGTHLLYYFRQENLLEKDLFINSNEIFSCNAETKTVLAIPDLKRYVFVDDFCGSGSQAVRYLKKVVKLVKELNEGIEVFYFVLFANELALEFIQNETELNKCDAVFKLDDTYKCFGENSRYISDEKMIDIDFTREMAKSYGDKIQPENPLGFGDNELLLGFFHNTPNNTLPIIWFDEKMGYQWNPIFRRYPKNYGDM